MPELQVQGKRKRGRPRKKAPALSLIDEVWVDPSVKAVAQAKRVLIAQGKEAAVVEKLHFYMGSRHEDPGMRKELGYEAVTENGEQMTDRGDPIWVIDKAVSDRRAAAPGLLAREQLRDAMAGEDGKYETVDAEGKTHRLTTD